MATPVLVGSGHWWRVYIQFLDKCEKFDVIVIVIVKIITCRIGDCGVARRRTLYTSGGLQVLGPVATMHLIARR
jgi:hypothetical protein